jgi:cell division protein FtsQ
MWDDPRQLNGIAASLALFATCALAWGALAWTLRQAAFEFREVVITGGLVRASPAHLEAVIRDELAGTFFTMDLERAREALLRVPWVRRVALRRQWPRRLEVTLEEHVPLARWNDSGLVDVDGEVFTADFDGELPQFVGPDARAAELTARYREWGVLLAGLSLSVEAVTLSPRGGWRLGTKGPAGDLEIELGRDEPSERLARFVDAYQRTVGVLSGSGARIDHVDLRYRNGFAARVPDFRERPARKSAP